MKSLSLLLAGTLASMIATANAQPSVPLVTFGSEAEGLQGDDDHTEVVFFKLPADVQGPLYLRLFDPDTGDALDEIADEWNTRVRFSVFGGTGAYSGSGLQTPEPTPEGLAAGVELAAAEFGVDPLTDQRWYTLAELSPDAGEKLDGSIYFRLQVQGIAGNDGNLYDLALSTDSKFNRPPEGLETFSFGPTLGVPGQAGKFAELRFEIPDNVEALTVRNFDLDYSEIWFETPLSSDFPLRASGNGEWQEGTLTLPESQRSGLGAVIVRGYVDRQNAAAVQVLGDGQPLPIQLPVLLQSGNSRPEPAVLAEFLSDCQSVVFDASTTRDRDGDELDFHWRFGDGEQADGERVIHRYAAPGTYTYELTAKDRSGHVGNLARKSGTLVVNHSPKAAAGPDRTVAVGELLTFDGSESSDTEGEIGSYLWDFGDGHRAVGAKVGYIFTRPGLYTVSLRVEDASGTVCDSATDQAEVWVNAQPAAVAGANQLVAPNDEVTFDAGKSSDSDGEITSYQWDFGDGSTGEGVGATHRYTAPGTYEVTLRISDNAAVTNSVAEDRLTVVVNQSPSAKPAVKEPRVAVGQEAEFDASASADADGALTAYRWDFGDGSTAEGAQVNYAYAKPGTYKVTLEVRDDSGTGNASNSDSLSVIVNDPPVAKAGSDQRVTESVVQFDGSASVDSDGQLTDYAWDFGDGEQGAGERVSHAYPAPGTYLVTLTVTDDSGTPTQQASDSLSVTVNAKPTAAAGPDRVVSPGQKVAFDGGASVDTDGEVVSYQWDFGDGETAADIAPTHSYTKPGVYSVRLRVQDDSEHAAAVGYDEAIVTVNAAPVAEAGADRLAAPGDLLKFDARTSYDPDGSIGRYLWVFSDGEEREGARVQHRFAEPGLYEAVLTVVDASGADNEAAEDKVKVRVNHPPLVPAGRELRTCDHIVRFDATASSDPDADPLRYSWDFGDGSTPKFGAKVAHSYAKGGAYTVKLAVDDGTGLANATSTTEFQVVINQPPIATAQGPDLACAGKPATFDATASKGFGGGELQYAWDFGDGSSATEAKPTKLYGDAGAYPVTLLVTDDSGLAGCNVARDRLLLQVTEAPVAKAGPDMEVCAKTPVRFDGGNSTDTDGLVNRYRWDFGDKQGADGRAPSHVYAEAGTYVATLTITGDDNGVCENTSSDTLSVTVYEAPVAAFTGPETAARGASVQFEAQPAVGDDNSAWRYAWDFGDGTKGDGLQVEHAFAKGGRYPVTLTVSDGSEGKCNSTSVVQSLLINDPPVAVAKGPERGAVYQALRFSGGESKDADGGIVEYLWDFGDGQQAEGVEVKHQYTEPGEYAVILRVTDNAQLPNSQVEDRLTVAINAPPEPVFSMPAVACAKEEVSFDASASRDIDGTVAEYAWDFGDGNQAQGAKVTHSYETPGAYGVTLRVTDDSSVANDINEKQQTIRVNNPPVADGGPARKACIGELIRFDAQRSTDRDAKWLQYQWDFGDGNDAQGARVSHRYEVGGLFTARLAVTDDSESACATATQDILVKVNRSPVARITVNAEQVFSGGAHDEVLFSAADSTDADSDALRYFWDFGDRNKGEGAQIWHRFSRPGQYRVKLRVADDSGTSCGDGRAEMLITVKGR